MLANHPNVLGGGGVATNIIGGTGLFANGTAAAPSISFLADQDTGIYRIGDNVLGLALGGSAKIAFYDSGGAQIRDPATNALLQFTSATGSVSLNANSSGSGAALTVSGGANANITLTPSGTGLVKVAALPTNAGNATAGSFTGVAFAAIINAAYGLVYGSSQSSGDGWIQQQSVVSGAYYNLSLQASGGNVLIGTNVNSGALLQVGTNTTTSAGGMVFGTDTSLYRSAAGALTFNSGAGLEISLTFSQNGSAKGTLVTNGGAIELGTSGATSLLLKTNATTALTLDSSQNATFAGTAITLASAAAKAGLRIPHGAAPTSPTNGDMWSTTAGLFIYIAGVTKTVTLT